MTYEDLVHEAGLTIELGTLHSEMDVLLQELRVRMSGANGAQ